MNNHKLKRLAKKVGTAKGEKRRRLLEELAKELLQLDPTSLRDVTAESSVQEIIKAYYCELSERNAPNLDPKSVEKRVEYFLDLLELFKTDPNVSKVTRMEIDTALPELRKSIKKGQPLPKIIERVKRNVRNAKKNDCPLG